MKIMKAMKPDDEEVVSITTTAELRQYKMTDEDFINYATLIS